MIKNFVLLAIMMLAVTSCVDKEPNYGNFPSKDVDFTYQVDGDEYEMCIRDRSNGVNTCLFIFVLWVGFVRSLTIAEIPSHVATL